MNDKEQQDPPRTVAFSNQKTLAGVPAPIVIFSFSAVVLVAAATLQEIYGIDTLLTLSNLMALSWLPIGPLLIRHVLGLTTTFLAAYQSQLPNETDARRLFTTFLDRWRRGRIVFGVPWAIIVTSVVVSALYRESPLPIQVWAIASFGPLFLISGFGFWGVVVMIRLVKDFVDARVAYRPYHPDRFGGLAAVGSYAVRGALYFSSGALVLPLAFAIIGLSQDDPRVAAIAYVVTAIFILFVFAAFAIPITDVKRLADTERVRAALDARARLQDLMQAFQRSPDHDEKLAREIEMCFQMECAEIEKLREYPYDLSVLAEIVIAIALPITIVVIEQLLQ